MRNLEIIIDRSLLFPANFLPQSKQTSDASSLHPATVLKVFFFLILISVCNNCLPVSQGHTWDQWRHGHSSYSLSGTALFTHFFHTHPRAREMAEKATISARCHIFKYNKQCLTLLSALRLKSCLNLHVVSAYMHHQVALEPTTKNNVMHSVFKIVGCKYVYMQLSQLFIKKCVFSRIATHS